MFTLHVHEARPGLVQFVIVLPDTSNTCGERHTMAEVFERFQLAMTEYRQAKQEGE